MPGKNTLVSQVQLMPAISDAPPAMRRLQLKAAESTARPSGQSFIDCISSGTVQRHEAPGAGTGAGVASQSTDQAHQVATAGIQGGGRPPPHQHRRASARTPIGTYRRTDFGEYWVVPDGSPQTSAQIGRRGELIEQAAFTRLETVWTKLRDGTGQLVITENDSRSGTHAGFRARVLPRLGMLMSRPRGRELIVGLIDGSKRCTIRPAPGRVYGGATTTAVGGLRAGSPGVRSATGPGTSTGPGTGADSFVNLDPSVTDTDIRVNDARGNEISDPVYIFLGHELIHARHIAAGEVDMGTPSDAAYGIKEEEITIATGNLNENDLRAEHGLTRRHGAGGRDPRP